jgi:hypothetical protein
MDHEFELAFNLLDEAAGRIQNQQYGITSTMSHNHGKIRLTTVHDYTRQTGHRLVLLANDDHGQMAAVQATAPDLDTYPCTRILKVRAGDLTFHAVPNTWSYRATANGHTYTITARIGDQPLWMTTIDHHTPTDHDCLDDAISTLLDHHTLAAWLVLGGWRHIFWLGLPAGAGPALGGAGPAGGWWLGAVNTAEPQPVTSSPSGSAPATRPPSAPRPPPQDRP